MLTDKELDPFQEEPCFITVLLTHYNANGCYENGFTALKHVCETVMFIFHLILWNGESQIAYPLPNTQALNSHHLYLYFQKN